ncbi:Uncharacterised protein [Actinobacillus porcinus]|uniref:Uncharacterized protein n=1 Tax=Actinobacillus porcinus TaxID=51048 RepID=A0ABY6THF5_9PAST|nr:Uncharacterised protein [Actinobacillus porcinus]VTU05879.1 Uncharacterised protein [Actinobacillus porcinus]
MIGAVLFVAFFPLVFLALLVLSNWDLFFTTTNNKQ